MIAQALLGAWAWPHAQRLRSVAEAELLQPGEPFPVGLRFSGRFDPLGRAAEGKEVREFAVEPAGEMPHGGVDADQRGLGQALPPKLFQEGFGHGAEPLLRVVMAAELVIRRGSVTDRRAWCPGWSGTGPPLR